MKVRENHILIIEKHPYFESVNEKLRVCASEMVRFKTREEFLETSWTNIYGERTMLLEQNPEVHPYVKLVTDWVSGLIYNNYGTSEEGCKRKIYSWFSRYDIGDSAQPHDHIPYSLYSYVYFIDTPKGSSPLVFTTSGKKVKAEEGTVVIFPSSVRHHVPKNRGKGRLVMAGNIALDIAEEWY